jgi:hypothetical protein
MVEFLAIAHVYNVYEEDGPTKVAPEMTLGLASLVAVLWTLTFVYFLFFVCVPKYRSSFWSTQTGKHYVESYFVDNEDDEEKRFKIFNYNELKWADIGHEVGTWTHANWARWIEEQPAWFTPSAISRVPDRFIPHADLAALGFNRERRGSAQESVRESVRRLSASD